MKEKNKDLLIFLLEGILKIKILKIEYINLEKCADHINTQKKYFVLFLNTYAEKMQVEIKVNDLGCVKNKNISYLYETNFSSSLRKKNYNEDIQVIQINFSYNLKEDFLLRIYYMQNDENIKYMDNLLIYELNMRQYQKLWNDKVKEDIEKNKEIIMLNLELTELEILSQENTMIKKYMEEINKINEKLKSL